ncbi:MAG: hypothetical protein JXA22_06045 [Candidatus Thermoplasmatota archaeon]|nr:hypothetical protein [Candidatus Thermoplasmatota archaeon]
MEEQIEEGTGRGGFLHWIRSAFGGHQEEPEEPEQPTYKRRLFDGRIEKYLDQNMSSYISEYGILTGLDLEAYEMRYGNLTGRISTMKDFILSADARISGMELEIDLVKKAAKGGK